MVGAVHVTTPHEYLYPIDSPFTGSISTPSISSTPSYSPPASSGGGGSGYTDDTFDIINAELGGNTTANSTVTFQVVT